MIFTFNGQNTYIFDLDRTGKALVLNQGVVDLGEASSPQCLAILRLEDNAVVMDIQATADNGEFHLVTEDDRQSFILDDGDTVEISGNQLHLSLHRNGDGDLLGGEFILESIDENNGLAGTESSGEKSNSDTSDTGVKHKSGGLFETLIYSSQPDTPSKTSGSDMPVPPKTGNDEELSETLVVDENLSETQVVEENLSETQVVEEQSSDLRGATENLSETRVSVEDLSETRMSVEDLSETRMSVEDLSETRITLEEVSETKLDGKSGKSTGGNEPQDASGNAAERLSGETSLIESTFFSVDVVNKPSQKKKSEKDGKERLLKIGDGIKEDSSTGEYDYHVMKYVGQGGFGQVYKIEDKYKNPFALKVLLPRVLEKSDFALKLFDQEVGIARFLEYSGLVKALEHYYDSKRNLHYCIMTYINGVSFTDVIDYYADRHTSMHYMFATLVVLKVAEALDYLSEHGVVHRDIKPQNVMLTRDGEVKVLDLGISRRDFNTQPLADNEVLGTLPYVPLGQFLHQDPVDVRVDIYSLGVMYYGLLTCDHPYSIPSRKLPRAQRIEQLAKELYKSFEKPSLTPNPRAKNKNVPESVAKVVMKMMAQDVKRRYKDADDLIHDLERITGDLTPKDVKRELSNLCDAVKNKKPVPVPTAGIRNRVTTQRKGDWMRPLTWIAVIVSILAVVGMFVLNQDRTGDFPKLEKRYKELEAEEKNIKINETLRELDSILTQLEKEDNGILANPSDNKTQWNDCNNMINDILGFKKQMDDWYKQVAKEVPTDWQDKIWVVIEAKKLWDNDIQDKFSEIQGRFNVVKNNLEKRAQEAIGKNVKSSEIQSQNIRTLALVPQTERANILQQLNDYGSEGEIIILCQEYLKQKNLLDDVRLQEVTEEIKGHEKWQDWCKDLWKIHGDLENVDFQTVDNVLKTAETKINELKKLQESFGGFKDDFNVALDQVCKKKQEMDVIRKVDSQYEKINAIVSEIGANMPSEEQLKQIRSICDNAGEIIKDNAELANKLASCKEKYKKINEVRQMLETLDNLDKRHQEFIRNMMDMKKLGDAGNVAAAEKNLEDIKEIFEKDRNKIIKLSETMKTVKFSHQKDDLAQKWNELIQEANGIVNNANMQIVKKDKILLQQESEELEDLVKSCSDYIVQMVSWNWSIERKEMDIQKLRTHKSDADRLLDNMKQRKTDDKAKTLQEKGQKNHDVIKDRVQAVEKGLLPILERFYNIKKELTDDNNEISQFEARAKMGSLQKDNMVNGIKETINELKRRNNTQFEAIAKLKDWSEIKPTYLPIVAIENLKGICGQLKKLQEDNGIKLRNFEKIWKSVVEFSQKMNELSWKVEELEELSKKIVNTKDVSRKEEVIDLYDQVNTKVINMKNKVNQVRNSIGTEQIQAIDKEVAKARSAWENCQKIFNQMEAFEKGMEELNLLLKRLKDEIRKLKLNISDFEKVEVAYKAFMDQSENTIIVFGVIPGKKIEEKKQLVANAKDMYESYEKIKKEKKREYETVKKEFDNVMGHLKKLNEKLENGEKVVFKDLGKAYYDVMEKYKQLSAIPGDKEIKKEQELLTKEQWPEAERLYRKSLKSLDFLEYNENYSSLQRELGKRKWGLRVSEVKIQEKIKTCRGLAEALLQDEGLSLEKRKFLEDNLKELQKLEKK